MNQNDYPKIPEGKYPAIYVGFKKSRWISQDKLYLEFEIVEEPFKGKRLVHYYNVHFSPDRNRVGAGFMSNFLRDYARNLVNQIESLEIGDIDKYDMHI